MSRLENFRKGTLMMKRLVFVIALLCMLLSAAAFALEKPDYIEEDIPDVPQWTAENRIQTRIRKVKDMDSKDWLARVEVTNRVNVYWWSEEWCVCEFKGDIGYLPTERLWNFVKVADSLMPGSTPVEGVATMTEDVFLAVEKYSGNTALAGTQLCVQESGLVPMMRLSTMLPEGSFTFEPFVPAEESKAGDPIYGFTTFYNADLGGQLPENRDYNLELAVERLQGIVIQPGEKFSFNQYCAPYTKKNGYLKAKNVSKDGYGFGGGVCQVSTTIFCAIGGIDYTLDEWQLHSYAGVKYVPRNLDAAVSTYRDFAFINDEKIPLKLEVLANEGVLTVILRNGLPEPAVAVVTEITGP